MTSDCRNSKYRTRNEIEEAQELSADKKDGVNEWSNAFEVQQPAGATRLVGYHYVVIPYH